MVRAGSDNELPALFEKEGIVAIGWSEMEDLSGLTSRQEFKNRYAESYPSHSQNRRATNAGQMYRFVRKISPDDYVLTYIKDSREVLIGRSSGGYDYRPGLLDGGYPNTRSVDWIEKVSRDAFTAPARNSMGSTLTVFSLDEYVEEIHRIVAGEDGQTNQLAEEAEETPPFYDEIKSQSDELIADLVHHLDPYDFQDLVAGVLRAMGFEAVSTPPGPDQGVDILAHPDAFGFKDPRIKVQVKHRSSSTGAPDLRSFLGTLHDGENGIYVSTGGFTTDAKRAAESARKPITLLNRDDFIQLLLQHYEKLESEFKAQIPLRRVWVPAE